MMKPSPARAGSSKDPRSGGTGCIIDDVNVDAARVEDIGRISQPI